MPRIIGIGFALLLSLSAPAQIQFVDLATLATNTTASTANLTIPGVCFNAPCFATNYANVTIGDPLPSAFTKINSDFAYCAGQFTALANLPNQINSGWSAATANLTNLVLQANVGLITVSNSLSHFFNTNTPAPAGSAAPDITDLAGKVGIDQSAPAYALDVNGPVKISGGASSLKAYTLISNDSYGTMWFTSSYPGAPYATEFTLGAGAAVFHCKDTSGNSYGIIYCDSSSAKIANDQTAQAFQVADGGQMLVTDASGLGISLDGSGNFCNNSAFSSDWGSFCSDGNGNVTCTTLTQTSDLNTKTNLAAVDSAAILKRLLAVPVYRWNFRDYLTTNCVVLPATNSPAGRASPRLVTNAIVRQHLLSSATHFGPLAQDWSAGFGGRTNGISVLDMQGLLLAGLQALASPARTAAVAGTIHPANAWDLFAITNAMPNFSIWQGNSNGALVTLSLSNGTVRCLQILK